MKFAGLFYFIPMEENQIPLTIEILKSLGFSEEKAKIGRRFYVWHGCASIDIVLRDKFDVFEFISYKHQPFEIKTVFQLKVLIIGLTGKELGHDNL